MAASESASYTRSWIAASVGSNIIEVLTNLTESIPHVEVGV